MVKDEKRQDDLPWISPLKYSVGKGRRIELLKMIQKSGDIGIRLKGGRRRDIDLKRLNEDDLITIKRESFNDQIKITLARITWKGNKLLENKNVQ